MTAGLTDIASLALRALADALLVRDLRFADSRLDAEFAQQAVNDDFQMQLAHAGDDRLTGRFVGIGLERRIFLRQTNQRKAHLVLHLPWSSARSRRG